MKVIELSDDFFREIDYYDSDKYFWFLYELYNQNKVKEGEEYTVSIPQKYNDTDYPDIVRIVSFKWEYGEMEGDQSLAFVIKVSENTFKEFIIELSSWDGPEFEGPFDVYPTNVVVYKRQKL